MRHDQFRSLVFGLLTATSTLSVFADVKEHPYGIITERNPFALKPIPVAAPAPPEAAPAPPEIELKLTGIGTLVGPPRVFLEVVETKTKKAERLLPMTVGQQDNGIEVLAIDPIEYTVRIRRGDTETTLNFEKNGYRPGDLASVPPLNLPAPPRTVPNLPPPVGTSKLLVDGKPIAPPDRPLTLAEAREVLEIRRAEMERNRPGSSVILPPTGTTPQQAAQSVPDSGAPVRFRGR